MNSKGISARLNARREEIDDLLAKGARQVDVAHALDVKPSTFCTWLRNRDVGQEKTDDEVQDALRRLAESVGA